MNLHDQWRGLIENQTDGTVDDFWDEYSDAEISIYATVLDEPKNPLEGTISELSQKFKVRPIIFMGFLDGVLTSLKEDLDLGKLKEDSQVKVEVDVEKLYFNMLTANAEHLYTLSQWDSILTEEKREDISKAYKKSKTIIKEKLPGRNDPCPCGSNKKYKKCCGS